MVSILALVGGGLATCSGILSLTGSDLPHLEQAQAVGLVLCTAWAVLH